MARKKSKVKSYFVLLIIIFACVGGYSIWNNYGAPSYDVMKVKYEKIRKALDK